ncbi:hypothetical protein Goarm_022315 [Gossypium armourianum]|uniref:Malectin-like domain-containing protein n=2 Tax=Gossypium armourianum TaxID=34283 RepID=A0A7J9KF59_9ROSI|nr:hypothetical protein [Gossypium armourianum]
MFRLNVDGQSIPPSKDADGLLGSWYNDDPYLYGFVVGEKLDANKDIDIAPSTLLNPKFYDALLNGVEIFKLNNGNKNLAGSSNLQPSAMLRQSTDELPNSIAFKSNNGVASAWAAGRAAVAFVVVAILVFTYVKRK